MTLLDQFLQEQADLTAVERFAREHDAGVLPHGVRVYKDLIPLAEPGDGQQYGFEVDLDACTGCKACVSACHSLNGLDEDESWRSVGLLHGGTAAAPLQQTVTTTCHHCVDPGCMKGCPVDAYEKDPVTGIVSHLDDQCIGCGYCALTCPYEVPLFSPSRGIVRKCDMCRDRLAEGEAPACVQSCPNEAIRIAVVDVAVARAEAATGAQLVPGAPVSSLTVPTTTYRTARPELAGLRPADHFSLQPAKAHPPLAVMLVLTQLAVGAVAVDLSVGRARGGGALVAAVMGLLALGASVLHLGRPRFAFRAVLGFRHSWLSREIVAFGVFAALTVAYGVVGAQLLGWLATGFGVAGVVCSVMIYAVTGRTWWRTRFTGPKFALTTLACGLAAMLALEPDPTIAWVLIASAFVKLALEAALFLRLRDRDDSDLTRTALLLATDLAADSRWRFALGVLGGLVAPALVVAGVGAPYAVSVAGAASLLTGELIERSLFFRAAVSPRMPGQPS